MELTPCPFCGNIAPDMHKWKPDAVFHGYSVWCECGAKTGGHSTKAEAIAAWNRREAARPESCYKKSLEDAIEKMNRRAKSIEGDSECQNAFYWGCADGLKRALELLEGSGE